MKKLSALLSILAILMTFAVACDDEDSGPTYSLSGNLAARFEITEPTNTATIKLVSSDAGDCLGAALYSDTANTWEIATKGAEAFDRVSSYTITGVKEGTYKLCGSIGGENLYDYQAYGPSEITISGDETLPISFAAGGF